MVEGLFSKLSSRHFQAYRGIHGDYIGTTIGIHSPRKIGTLVRRGGEADPDCPDDPESTRYCVFTGGSIKDMEKESHKGSVKVNVKGSTEIAAALMCSDDVILKCATSSMALAAPGTEAALSLVANLASNLPMISHYSEVFSCMHFSLSYSSC